MTDKFTPEQRAAIERIKAELGDGARGTGATDDDAVGWAVEALALSLENQLITMTKADLWFAMANYAGHALSRYLGEIVIPVQMPDGKLGFQSTGQALPDDFGPPMTMQ